MTRRLPRSHMVAPLPTHAGKSHGTHNPSQQLQHQHNQPHAAREHHRQSIIRQKPPSIFLIYRHAPSRPRANPEKMAFLRDVLPRLHK